MSNKNNLQIYFWEILREFFDYWTPSHYRVQLSNPRMLLHELLAYCEIYNGTVHLQQDHIWYMIDEYLYYSNKDITFNYYKTILIDFHLFLKWIKNGNKENFTKDVYLLITRLKSILREIDEKYYIWICKQISDLFLKSETNIDPRDFTKLKKICFSFSTEILRRWYSKWYTYDKIWEYLICDFKFEAFINSFNGDKILFSVYLKVSGGIDDDIEEIFSSIFWSANVSQTLPDPIEKLKPAHLWLVFEKANNLLLGFKRINPLSKSLFLSFQELAIDPENALNLSKIKINNLFDKINIEFPYKNISIHHHWITINETNNTIMMPSTVLQLDWYRMKSSVLFFNAFNEKLDKILWSGLIDIETKNKIQTLLQFHRHFSDADMLEHKFLNLWIWWEHVFSLSIFKDWQTWKNINTFFPYIHALWYFENLFKDMINVQLKRNLKNTKQRLDFKKDLEIKLSDNVFYQLANLYSLIKKWGDTWDNFLSMTSIEDDDLTKVKLFRLKEKTKDPQKFISHIQEKTKWELFRMYRVRNAIVHKWNIIHLWLPIEVLLTQLEYFYQELLDIIINRFSCNERFSSIEQLFLSFERTYKAFDQEKWLSEITEPADIKNKILNRPLIY